MTTPRTALATILFTDIVGSTELLQRAGDEDAQRMFKEHHRLLSDAVAMNGGHEVKWLGDGLMVAFPSAGDAVRCAISMQQASQRAGAGVRIRVGLNVGDTLRDETDYFGTPVVIAKRLCDRAEGGQILCSSLVAGLLAGRQAFSFEELGGLELKGIAAPVQACTVVYERDEPGAFLARTPFVGRANELGRLFQKLDDARAGSGGMVMLAGEPGIGKTRMCEEFASRARASNSAVLWGRCFDGEWTPPYGPFADAIAEYARTVEPALLLESLGPGASAIGKLVPAVGELLDLPEPPPLQADEERFRLLDAVSQMFLAIAARSPLLLILDDLHWADRGTIAMLRHVARFVKQHPIVLVGTYRDVDLDRQHPLSDALSALRRETEYERIALRGLGLEEVRTLISTIGEQEANPALIQAISDETEGNPFFIREVLLHLVEEGKLFREGGEWRSSARSISDLGIPEGVRQVISRRLSRLSANANKLLTAASGLDGSFRFDIACEVAQIDEAPALDALDEALGAHVVRPSGDPDGYEFTHALLKQTLYTEMNPSRQVRLHRQIAEAMESALAAGTDAYSSQLAHQYHRSAAIPGAERGVLHALAAADRAESAGAWDEAASMLRIAFELALPDDGARLRIEGRLAIALAWALEYDEALERARDVGERIARTEGNDAAADYFALAARACGNAGFERGAWDLAPRGLRLIGARRDETWAAMMMFDLIRREAEGPEGTGLYSDTPDRRELFDVFDRLPLTAEVRSMREGLGSFTGPFATREEGLRLYQDIPTDDFFTRGMRDTFWLGRWDDAVVLWRAAAEENQRLGRIAPLASVAAFLARCHYTLGNIDEGHRALAEAQEFAARLGSPSIYTLQVIGAQDERNLILDEGWEGALQNFTRLATAPVAENAWAQAPIYAGVARVFARLGMTEQAVAMLAQAAQSIERLPAGSSNYPRMVSDAANVLWLLERTDHIDVIERNVREKVVVPDFRYLMFCGRLALARLSALQGRYDDASAWFTDCRRIADEGGARPTRAVADHDEALMLIRRGETKDRDRARALLKSALAQFREIGMTGWEQNAEALLQNL